MARTVVHSTLGEIRLVDQAVMMSRTPSDISVASPECGEHTDEILAEFGLSEGEVSSLRAVGAI